MVICSRLKKSFVLLLHKMRFQLHDLNNFLKEDPAISKAMYYDGGKRRGFEDLNINFDFHYFSITFHFPLRIFNFSVLLKLGRWVKSIFSKDIKVSEVEWLVKC